MQCHTDHRGFGEAHMVSISNESSHAGAYLCLTPGTRMHANKPFCTWAIVSHQDGLAACTDGCPVSVLSVAAKCESGERLIFSEC